MSEQGSIPPRWGGDSGEVEKSSPPSDDSLAQQPAPPSPGPWGMWATLGWMLLMIGAIIVSSFVALVPYSIWISNTGDEKSRPKHLEILAHVGENGDFLWISSLVTVFVCGAVLLLAILSRAPYPISSYLALKKAPARKWLVWIIALVLYAVGSDFLLYLVGIEPVPNWMRNVYQSAVCLPCLLIAVIVLAPLLEELVFRGFVFTGIQARRGLFWAVFFATVPWALLHLQYQWYYLIVALGLGLLFSLARAASGSIYLPIAMHALNNIIATVQVQWGIYP